MYRLRFGLRVRSGPVLIFPFVDRLFIPYQVERLEHAAESINTNALFQYDVSVIELIHTANHLFDEMILVVWHQ